MKVSSFILNVTSEHPERLMQFYRDTVQLTPHPQIEQAFTVGEGAAFAIDGHSETLGPAKEPQRALINFWVDLPADVVAERERLEGAGVRFIRKEGTEYWGGVISTFLDPDGNYCQLMSMKGSE
jgi:predicted enzyme related to lactoylglutathione lyase